MAESDKIRSEDIIQKDLFKNTIESAEDLTKTLGDLEKEFVKVAESQAKIAKQASKDLTAENLEKTTKAISKASEARERANKIAQERVKLEEKLKIATSSSVDANTELKVLIQEQNKINKELAKEKLGLISAYEKESKRLNTLRKQYKDLAIAGKENTKEAKDLLKQIRNLDKQLKDIDASVGQFQRSVGDYSKQALGSAKATTAFALALVGLKGDLDDIKGGINANEEAGEDFRTITEQLGAGFQVVQNRAGRFAKGLFELGKQAITGKGNINEFIKAQNDVTNAFKGTLDEIDKVTEAQKDVTKDTIVFEKRLLSLSESLAIVNGQIEKQSVVAGDATKTFAEQQEAIQQLERLQIERAKIQKDIAQGRIKLLNDEIIARSGLSEKIVENANAEDLFAKVEKNLRPLIEERTEANIALIESEAELASARAENSKVFREVQRDIFERELDFAIDAFDAQKTINERQIADDRKTIEERQAIFDETVRLAESSFQSQKDLFAEFVDDRVDFDALVAETDEAAIRRTIEKLDLDDIELGRALEVIKERKFAIQDLDDAERDLSDARTERFQRDKDAQDRSLINTLETQEALAKGIEEQFDIREDILREQARIDLENAELQAEERLEIEKRLQNDILLLNQERVEASIQLERDLVDSRINTAKSISEVSQIIAGEDEQAQRAILATQKAIAISEILINSQREVSDIRATEKNEALKQSKITEARAAALAGVATVLAQGSFYDGTEDTGSGGKADDRGGFYAVLHPHERVMTARQNAKVGDLTNNELADIALMYNKGHLINPFTDFNLDITDKSKQIDRTHILVDEITKLRNDINAKPVQQVNVDSFGNLVEVVYRNSVKDTITHKAKKWL